MFRIDDNQNVATLPAPPTDNVGTPGFFTGGNPGASPPVPATRVRFWWLNLVQESLMALLSAAGLTGSKTDFTLVLQSILILARGRSQVFSVVGSFTFTVPANVTRIRVRVVGGGGGGANSASTTPGGTYSSGGGGGAGGYAEGVYTVTPGQQLPVTVGAGGGAQNAGSTSSLGTLASATGGSGSTFATSTISGGGQGGTGIGGTLLNLSGGFGSDGQSGSFVGFGNGAPGPFGGAGRAANSNGVNAQAPGAGGGGAYGGNYTGGIGAPGIVIVEF